MNIVCDLHLHSKYSRATSKDLDIEISAQWAKWKGIDVVGTGDALHPLWLTEISQTLQEDPVAAGLYRLKDAAYRSQLGESTAPRFMLTVETSHVYTQSNQSYRIHLLTLMPNIETVQKIRERLLTSGVKLDGDGRPILSMSVPQYCDLVLTSCEDCMIIPAHIWTPWYSMYGSVSGFNSFNECFQEFAPFIHAVESGLSSDPAMNWRIQDLDNRSVVSFSDAHSPSKLGREVTVVESELTYQGITDAMKHAGDSIPHIVRTVEYYPEGGKYHFDGHRKCNVCQSPEETKKRGEKCSVCGRKLTLGVLHRVEDLATRMIELKDLDVRVDEFGVRIIRTPKGLKPPYVTIVPLLEILSEVYRVGVSTKTVQGAYTQLISNFGTELDILLKIDTNMIAEQFGSNLANAIECVRGGEVQIEPGFDGEYGKVTVAKQKDLLSQEKMFTS